MNEQRQQLTPEEASALHRRALEGDVSSFWEFVGPHQRTIFAVAVGVLKNGERAEDVVHDVYLRAFSTLGNLRSPDKLGSWLYSMTKNIAHEHLRRDVRQERIASSAPQRHVISVPDMLIKEEELRTLEKAMEGLPEAHRMVLGLKYMNNMSCREIAEILGIGLEATKSRLFEARKALRKRMKAADQSTGAVAPPHPAANARGEQ